MPIRKFRDVADMDGPIWRHAGDPSLFRAIRATWTLAARTTRRRFPPGVYKHASITSANRLRDDWEQAHIDRRRSSAQRT